MRNKHIVLTKVGEPEALELREDELPEPKADEVLIKILAAGVSYADVMMRRGKYPPGMPRLPFTPGYDLVGIIEKCGTAITELSPGHRVAALTQTGSYSQYICLPGREVVPMPGCLDPAEAVSLVLNYVTAFQMLHRLAHIKTGERILIHGAAGGVGTALLQLGTLFNLEMYGTVSRGKQELISYSGATPIDYTSEDFVTHIQQLPAAGVDAVFDAIGGKHLERSFQTLRAGGRLVGYGFSLANLSRGHLLFTMIPTMLQVVYWSLLPNGKQAHFYSISGGPFGMKNRHPEWFCEDLTKLFTLLEANKIKPVIARRLPLGDAAQAHAILENSQVQGKLVLIPNTL